MALALTAMVSAPTTTRYRIDQTLSQEVDASSAGQGKQFLTFHTTSFITVTLTDSAGGKAMRVVVDSMLGDSTTPIPKAVFDSVRGTAYRSFVTREGRPARLEATSATPAAAQVQGLLSDFFPWVRAGIKVGESWADTSANVTADGTDSVTVRRITAYRAAANDTHNSRKAVRVTTDYTSQVAGTQPTPNGPARIEGKGTGKGAYFVSSDGQYLGGNWQLQSALKISGAFAEQPLPVTLTQTTKVTALR